MCSPLVILETRNVLLYCFEKREDVLTIFIDAVRMYVPAVAV
jgi:hypothetical protein